MLKSVLNLDKIPELNKPDVVRQYSDYDEECADYDMFKVGELIPEIITSKRILASTDRAVAAGQFFKVFSSLHFLRTALPFLEQNARDPEGYFNALWEVEKKSGGQLMKKKLMLGTMLESTGKAYVQLRDNVQQKILMGSAFELFDLAAAKILQALSSNGVDRESFVKNMHAIYDVGRLVHPCFPDPAFAFAARETLKQFEATEAELIALPDYQRPTCRPKKKDSGQDRGKV